jgi:AcrR family transcriptional regulator
MRPKHSPEVKTRLLEAARHCLLKRGFDATVNDIVTRAGVAKGTFYHYFANKEACCRGTIESFLVSLAEILEMPALEDRPDGAALYPAWLKQNERFFSFCWDNRAMFRLLLGRSGGSAYDDVLEEFAARTANATEAFARELAAKGIYRNQHHPQLVARFVSGGYEHLVRQLIHSSERPDLLELSQIALETISLGLLGETARRSIQSSARVRSQLRRRRSTPLESARLAPNRPAPQLVSLRNKR